MFRVTQVEYEEDGLRKTVPHADTAPMPVLQHTIDQWWVRSGKTYRTPLMTGTEQ